MQCEKPNENVTMMDRPPTAMVLPLPAIKDPQIQRIRKCLLIILGFFLVLSLIGTIILVLTQIYNSRDQHGMGTPWKWSTFMIPVVFYSFGIFVAYKYWATGLRVFAWLCIVLPILIVIGVALYLLLHMPISTTPSNTEKLTPNGFIFLGLPGIIIEVIICGFAFCLTVLMIVFSFKLARLINTKTSLATQQI